jgi:hypothetical protein
VDFDGAFAVGVQLDYFPGGGLLGGLRENGIK